MKPTNEVELLIMVTPELVDAMDANEVPQCGPGMATTSPTDWELYMKGHLEVPNCCPNGNGGDCSQKQRIAHADARGRHDRTGTNPNASCFRRQQRHFASRRSKHPRPWPAVRIWRGAPAAHLLHTAVTLHLNRIARRAILHPQSQTALPDSSAPSVMM